MNWSLRPATPVATLLLLGLLGCNKIDFGADEGISHRSPNNLPEGPQDPTDWTSDVRWSKSETNLFKDLGLELNATQNPSLVRRIDAYPNPAAQGSMLAVRFDINTLPANTLLVIRIVDKKYKVIRSGNPFNVRAGGVALSLELTKDKFAPKQTYRLYYVLYTTDNQLLYKGHGDVKVVR